VRVGRRACGTLLLQNLLPGRTLYLLCTGTGLAPFISVIRDPDVYARFDRGAGAWLPPRERAGLCRGHHAGAAALPLIRCRGGAAVDLLPHCHARAFRHQGRIPALLESAQLNHDIGLPAIDARHDRYMLCGSPMMLRDTRAVLEKLGLGEGNPLSASGISPASVPEPATWSLLAAATGLVLRRRRVN